MIKVTILTAPLLLVSGALGATINVPADHPTIQAAIDAAIDGDEIVVADGTYAGPGNVNLDFDGRVIMVRSTNGPESCTIDCEGATGTRGFVFQSGETEAALVEGFTITRGCAGPSICYGGLGGAVLVDGASPTLADCVFRECSAFSGGALYIDNGHVTLDTCEFVDNIAGQGGAIMTNAMGEVSAVNCNFTGNSAEAPSPLSPRKGGAVYIFNLSSTIDITFDRCSFIDNTASLGGAVCGEGDPSTDFDACIFADNSVEGSGGALWLDGSPETNITNCLFVRNSAPFLGSALGLSTESGFAVYRISNCTFVGNLGGNGAVYTAILGLSSTNMTNCILRNNIGEHFYSLFHPVLLSYSNVQGDLTPDVIDSGGNIDADPLFADPDHDEYWLTPDSPCIDAGNNSAPGLIGIAGVDLAGGTRYFDDPGTTDTGAGIAPLIDIGAYEYSFADCNENGIPDDLDITDGTSSDCNGNGTPDECEADCNRNGVPDDCDITAGTSLDLDGSGVPDECETPPCPADLNGDNSVGAVDLAQLLGAWGPNPGSDADLDGDDAVGASDLAMLLGSWGTCR